MKIPVPVEICGDTQFVCSLATIKVSKVGEVNIAENGRYTTDLNELYQFIMTLFVANHMAKERQIK
jgi:hypothetical protein